MVRPAALSDEKIIVELELLQRQSELQLREHGDNLPAEATKLKRRLRVLKNRLSAKKSREERKCYMSNLELLVKNLQGENERLRAENAQLRATHPLAHQFTTAPVIVPVSAPAPPPVTFTSPPPSSPDTPETIACSPESSPMKEDVEVQQSHSESAVLQTSVLDVRLFTSLLSMLLITCFGLPFPVNCTPKIELPGMLQAPQLCPLPESCLRKDNGVRNWTTSSRIGHRRQHPLHQKRSMKTWCSGLDRPSPACGEAQCSSMQVCEESLRVYNTAKVS